jgi:two-component system, NarL family, sensor histidine kinase UhpB
MAYLMGDTAYDSTDHNITKFSLIIIIPLTLVSPVIEISPSIMASWVSLFFHPLKRESICGFILLLTFCTLVRAQEKEDSLLIVLGQTENELSRVNLLIQLSESAGKSNLEKARQYSHQALRVALANEFAKEICVAYNSLGELFHLQSAYDSSFYYHRKALDQARAIKNDTETVAALQGIARNFMRKSELDSARWYLTEARIIITPLKDYSREAGIYNDLGNVCIGEQNYTEALKQFIAAARLYESVSPRGRGLGKALGNIGNIEHIQRHLDKALDYTLRSLKLFEDEGVDSDLAYTHKLLGRIYRTLKIPEKALQNYEQALGIYVRFGDKRNASEVRHGIGNIYYDQRKFKEALHEYEESLLLAGAISDQSQMAYIYSAIGYAWYELKDAGKSIANFDSSILKARRVKNRYIVMDAYQVLSSIQEEQGNYKKALKLNQAFSDLKDSLNTEQNNQATEELETKYQTTKKQTEIELLQKDQQLKAVTVRQQRTVQTALLAAIILIVAISLLVFNRYRFMQRARQQAEAEQMRNQLARDLHDDIGSTLSVINIISQLALKENKPEYFTQHFRRIGEQSAKMMESMSDMIWSINPGNDSLGKMVVKMKEFLAEILEPKNISYRFSGEETLGDIVLNPQTRKSLFLIFKEAINNCAKYSEGSFVDIVLLRTEDQLHLTITDDGKGFDPGGVKNGNGLRNMRERAKEMNALLELCSEGGNGTTIKLVMPLDDRLTS